MTWLTNWNIRKQITVNGSTVAQSDYQMKLTVNQAGGTDTAGIIYLGGNVLTTFNDLRFTKSDGTTTLNYWIESITGSSPNQVATVWVKLAPSPDTIPASPGTYNFYIYYNNISASIGSNGINTFILFDDFADGNYTTNPVWTPISGSWSASGNYLTTTTSSINADIDIGTPSNTSTNAEWQWQWQFPGTTVDNWNYIGSVKFNYIDANNYYLLLADIRPNGYNTNMYFQKYVAGSYTSIGTISLGTSWGSNTSWHTFKITRDSLNEFKIYLDNTLKITATDSSHTSSSKLVANFNIGGSGPRTSNFDNFRIRKYTSPEPTFSISGTEELGITAYSMSLNPSENPCRTGICTITATVTWQNLGSSNVIFRPKILVDGTTYVQAASDITIGPYPAISSSIQITTPTLLVGTHSICPSPN